MFELANLDISPMLAAMREQPAAFSMTKDWLRHRPSRHRFKVDPAGHVIVDAECGCAALSVRIEQGRELYEALKAWREEYWIPHQVNQHFARHFRPQPFWRRWWNAVVESWTGGDSEGAFALYGQTWGAPYIASQSSTGEPPLDGPKQPTRPRPLEPSAGSRRETEDSVA